MADVDLTGTTALPAGNTVRVTMDATAGDVRRVLLPSWPTKMTMSFYASNDAAEAGYFEFTPSLSDSDAKTTAAYRVLSGASYPRRLNPLGAVPAGGVVIYLAGTTGGGYCLIDLEP